MLTDFQNGNEPPYNPTEKKRTLTLKKSQA
jgi:hypothetical protein